MDKIRFAVADSDGGQSAPFSVWTGPHDIYASARVLGQSWKATIHLERPDRPTELRYIGLTGKFTEQFFGQRLPVAARTLDTWPGRKLGQGLTLELRIWVPASELRPLTTPHDKPVKLIPCAPPGFDRQIAILHGTPMSPGDWPGRGEPNKTELVWSTSLANETVWVVHYLVPAMTGQELQKHRMTFIGKPHRGWLQPGLNIKPGSDHMLLGTYLDDGSALWLDLCTDFLAGAVLESA